VEEKATYRPSALMAAPVLEPFACAPLVATLIRSYVAALASGEV
jgi:hypothetical protein